MMKGFGTKTTIGASSTEAWAEIAYVKEGSRVTIPSEEAVERAKAWVEEHEM